MSRYVGKSVVILLSGKLGVGKTHIAKILYSKLFNESFWVGLEHFATSVKECATEFFNWNGDKDEKGRLLLQSIGRIGREHDRDLWANSVVNRLDSGLMRYDFVIIDDWRFVNELSVIYSNNYNVIPVNIIGEQRIKYEDPNLYCAESEVGLDDFNNYFFTIDNNKSAVELDTQLDTLIEKIFDRKDLFYAS